MKDISMAKKRQDLLADLDEVLQRALVEHGVPVSVASIASTAVRNRLAEYWGGQTISFPKNFRWKLHELELAIYDAFDGQNFDDLARQHDMTVRGMRYLIARVRAKIASGQADTQLGLLDSPAGS